MIRKALIALLALFALTITGCGDDDDDGAAGSGGSAGSGGTEADAGDDAGAGGAGGVDGGDGGDVISISWSVMEFREGFTVSEYLSNPGLEGVEVCLIESVDIPCTYTNEAGIFELQGVPKNSELLLTFTKEDYIPFLVPLKTGTDDIPGPAMQPLMVKIALVDNIVKAAIEDGFIEAGLDIDYSKGAIVFGNLGGGTFTSIYGVSASIDPQSGDGPFYCNENLEVVPDATSASEGTTVIFFNLDEREYILSWELEEPELYDCSIFGPIWGLPAEEPNTIKVPVRAGFMTGTILIGCEPTTDPGADAGT